MIENWLLSYALPLLFSFPVTSKPTLAAQPLTHAAVTLITSIIYLNTHLWSTFAGTIFTPGPWLAKQ